MEPSPCRHHRMARYHSIWHSYEIKTQYAQAAAWTNFFLLFSPLWSIRLVFLITLYVGSPRLATFKPLNTVNVQLSTRDLLWSFSRFVFWWIPGEKIFLRQKTKLEIEQKCVIHNYSISNPVCLPVAEPQLDSSSCKPIRSFRTFSHFSAFEKLFLA